MPTTMIKSEVSKTPLVTWIEEVFRNFESQRRELLEEDWDLSYDAFKGKYSESNLKKWRAMEGTNWRSQVFVRLTKMKVMAAVANVTDVMLQGGGSLPFIIKPTPIPQNVTGVMDKNMAKQRAGNMNLRMQDVLTQCKYDRVLMTSILENAIYGMCVQKSPVVRVTNKLAYRYELPLPGNFANVVVPNALRERYGRHVPYMRELIQPKVESTNLWDIFWDLECEDPQDGMAIIHRQKITPARLREMANRKKGWDREAVESVIKDAAGREATSEESEGPARQALTHRYKTIRLLEYWGRVPNAALRNEWDETLLGKANESEIFTILANDRVVYHAIPNPLPAQMRPFHWGYWEKLPHEAQGVGVPANMRDAQMMVNSGVRCFIDNKALSGNVLGAVNTGALEPGTSLSVFPGKVFRFNQGVGRIGDAIQYFSPPDVGRGLLELVNLFERFADEESGIPKLLQGENPEFNPETAYATSRLIEAGNRQMGNVIRNLDEGIVEPVVESLYHYLMVNDPDENIKGDYNVQALGFSSYQDRITRSNNLTEYLALALSDPILRRLIHPKPFMEEIGKLRDLDIDTYLKTDDELEKEAAEIARQMAMEQAKQGLTAGESAQVA